MPTQLISAAVAAVAVATAPADAAMQRATDKVLDAGAPSVVVGVREHGRTQTFRAGVADRVTRRTVAPDARFRIGSVSKVYLATAVLQLVQDGRLGLDDTLAAHLPGVLPHVHEDEVTVRMLLDHTSGTPDAIARIVAHPERLGRGAVTPAALVALARGMRPTHAPGTRFSYSNTDYDLLAMIVEQVTGAPYTDALRTGILEPLHLRETVLPTARTTLPMPFLRGYSRRGGGALRDATRFNASVAGPSGGIVATVGDVDRFIAALSQGRLLAPRTLALMRGDAREAARHYGLGLQRWRTSCGHIVFGHQGAALGYAARAVVSRDGGTQLAVGVATDESPAVDRAIDGIVDAAIC